MVGQLALNQFIGVRIPTTEPNQDSLRNKKSQRLDNSELDVYSSDCAAVWKADTPVSGRWILITLLLAPCIRVV